MVTWYVVAGIILYGIGFLALVGIGRVLDALDSGGRRR
jgi:hypothetical protein